MPNVTELTDDELNREIRNIKGIGDNVLVDYSRITDDAVALFDRGSRHDVITCTEKGFLVQIGMRGAFINHRNAMGVSENKCLARAIAEAYFEAHQ